MALLKLDQRPTIADTILFDIFTTDSDGNLSDPYKVDQITIYFVERDYNSSNREEFTEDIRGFLSTFTYKDAVPIKVYGTDDFPAWLSSDTAGAFITHIDFDEDNNPEVGHFQLEWTPATESMKAREGDYFICYTWTPVAGGDSFSKLTRFYLSGNFIVPTVPSQKTNPQKYVRMLDRYTPDMFKQFLASADATPSVIQILNAAVADGFTELENLANQLVSLLDANVVQEAFLPYIANQFRWILRSDDPTLWRRQIKQAIPLYKRKGTLGGLREALAECGVEFRKLTYYWQIVSKFTWQEAFIVEDSNVFCLAKLALLPTDDDNFHVFYRASGSSSYEEVPLSYVDFQTIPGTDESCMDNVAPKTCVTWITDIITLSPGDVVRILYKIAEPTDQELENYIQTLPIADERDELNVTYPVKNWNVRLIAEDDVLFPVVCPVKHPFTYPVVYGRVRTEFPYSEKIYNMDEYNGGVWDSTDPCDFDYTFYETCSCCRSSKISVDIAIEKISNDRITEVESIIRDFLPFHAQVHSINYIGLIDELVPPPVESLECLLNGSFHDNFVFTQFDFDRVILDGKSDVDVIKRDMLADATTAASGTDGVGTNLAITIFSSDAHFGEIGINNENNFLEILSGINQGEYELQSNDSLATADVIGTLIMNNSGFPFRFSNINYEELGASVYQDNVNTFSDANVDFSLFPIPNDSTWSIKVLTGIHAGVYPILDIKSDNTLLLSGWSGGIATSLSYELDAPGNIVVTTGTTGKVAVQLRGRLETQLIQEEYAVKRGDYVLFSGQQYLILFIGEREELDTQDKFYIDGYSGGDQVGSVNFKILRRLVYGIGYLAYRGMKLQTTANYETVLGIQNGQNPTSPVLDNNDFKENYLILLGTTYYTIIDINGQDIYLGGGSVLDWGLNTTTGISYEIIQFNKVPVTIQSGLDGELRTFEPFIDRRGEGSDFVIEQNVLAMAPMQFTIQILNSEEEAIQESVKTKESITCRVIEVVQ